MLFDNEYTAFEMKRHRLNTHDVMDQVTEKTATDYFNEFPFRLRLFCDIILYYINIKLVYIAAVDVTRQIQR